MLSRTLRSYSTASPAITSTLLLSRNPVITAEVPKFEAQYYKYQNELWKRLMWTFPSWFYYRKGTISEQAYRELNPGPVFNNPNIEFPRGRPEIVHQRDRRFKQVLRLPKTYKEVEANSSAEAADADADAAAVAKEDNMSRKIVPNSRITKADETKDLTSLERNLSRTLYLVIHSPSTNAWAMPNFQEESGESVQPLHKLAEEGLYKIGGEQINYFNVSNTPCHVYKHQDGKREYFIKSHIISGKFEPQTENLKFLWLAKEELKSHLNEDYYNSIEHLLSDI